ncbi:MAG: class I SAM-dependent methyltransferase [Acidobacteriota bacterium]
MRDAAQRFTSRVESYARYRPGYPAEIIDLLKSECGLASNSLIADVGSGTGILSELLLENGNAVFGVEPNGPMRAAGEALLSDYPRFQSIDGSAEATTLGTGTIDLITAGQAFHWFEGEQTRPEFIRILKPGGFVALIWNDRRLDSTPFLQAYEELLLSFGTDYKQVKSLTSTEPIRKFFAPGDFQVRSFPSSQEFDFDGLKGRVLSASYTPEPGQPAFDAMISRLREIFDANQLSGRVAFEYDTKVYYGQLTTG